MTYKQIDKRAEELFRACGGLPLEWGAVDECVRLHYRVMAEKALRREALDQLVDQAQELDMGYGSATPHPTASTDQAPCSQERKSSGPPIQKSASGLPETDAASRRE